MTDSDRRKVFQAWFEGPPMRGNRESFIKQTRYTKGRVSQFFNESEPFGERAARELAKRLDLDEEFFNTQKILVKTSGAPATSTQGGGEPLMQALQALTEALARLDAAQRERVAEKLQALARYPDSAIAQTDLAQAMGQAAPTVDTVPAPESKDFQPPVPPSIFAKTKQPL